MDLQPTYARFTLLYILHSLVRIVLFRLSRALANREENVLGVNFHECNLLKRNSWKIFLIEITGYAVYIKLIAKFLQNQ